MATRQIAQRPKVDLLYAQQIVVFHVVVQSCSGLPELGAESGWKTKRFIFFNSVVKCLGATGRRSALLSGSRRNMLSKTRSGSDHRVGVCGAAIHTSVFVDIVAKRQFLGSQRNIRARTVDRRLVNSFRLKNGPSNMWLRRYQYPTVWTSKPRWYPCAPHAVRLDKQGSPKK